MLANVKVVSKCLPVSCLVLAFLSRFASAASVTFAHDIAPIVYANCAPCHHAQGPAPFPLTSYEDVKKHGHQIADVTRMRFMPPWLPDQGHGDFAHELRLSDAQIRTIADWVGQGELEGEKVPPPPSFNTGWALGKPDVVVTASKAFTVPAGGLDVFWNFVFAPHVSESHYIRAIEIRPSNAKLIHHANVIVDRFGVITQGFAGMDVSVPRNPLDLDGHFLFFKPGAVSDSEPDGFCWRLDPTTTLILNTHMQPSGKVETEQPSIGLYFSDKPPKYSPYLLQLENDNGLNIPAGDRDFLVSDDFKLPIDTEVIAIYPHAHYLGKLLEAYATLPDGSRKWLIRIPNWDPNWQSVYHYREPVFLPAGTVVSMRYHYDNSSENPRNPHHPPRRVESGNQSTDEMAHLWLQVMPKNPHDSRRIYAEAWAKHQLDKNPNNFAANLTVGSLALARFDAIGAATPLRRAVVTNPNDAFAHNLYGTALVATGRMAEATGEFQRALKLKPDFLNARFNLAHVEAKEGKREQAVREVQEILRESPEDIAAKKFLQELSGQ